MANDLNPIFCEPFPFGRPDYYKNTPPAPMALICQQDTDAIAAQRLAGEQRVAERRRKQFVEGDERMRAILEVCRQSNEAVRITTIVNEVSKIGNPTWRERRAKKLELFQVVGLMVKQGRLDRVGGPYVTVPRSDARWKAYLESLHKPLDLPEPQLWPWTPRTSQPEDHQARLVKEARERKANTEGAILEACRRSPQAVRITTLANTVAKVGEYPARKDFEARKIEILKLVGRMLRQGRLARVRRAFVMVAPSDAKWKAHVEMATKPLDLPDPQQLGL